MKAYAFSHMMYEKLGSKSTNSLYTFMKSEVKKMTKLKWEKKNKRPTGHVSLT